MLDIFLQVCNIYLAPWRKHTKSFQAFNIFTDLVLATFPSLVVSNLNMRLRTKMGLIFLMSLGILSTSFPCLSLTQTNIIGLATL